MRHGEHSCKMLACENEFQTRQHAPLFKMKNLVIGDLHVSASNLSEVQPVLDDIVEQVRLEQPDEVVVLGDVFDKFQNVHVSCLRVVTKFIMDLLHMCKGDVWVLAGNHDRPNNTHFLTDEHPFHGLQNTPHLNIVATKAVRAGDNLYVPYVPDGRFHEAIGASGLDMIGVKCVFAHQMWIGLNLGHHISESGDVWASDAPMLFNGHIHGYQVFQPNLVCAGASWQILYSDSHDRALLLVDDSGASVTHRRIRLPHAPHKLTLELTCDELKMWKRSNASDQVHIKLRGTLADIQTTLKSVKLPTGVRVSMHRAVSTDTPVHVTSHHTTFEEHVRNAIKHNPTLLQHHNMHF